MGKYVTFEAEPGCEIVPIDDVFNKAANKLANLSVEFTKSTFNKLTEMYPLKSNKEVRRMASIIVAEQLGVAFKSLGEQMMNRPNTAYKVIQPGNKAVKGELST